MALPVRIGLFYTAGTVTLLMFDDAEEAVALERIKTVAAPGPNTSRVRPDDGTGVQTPPPSRLNSIVEVAPEMLSFVALYTAFGAALRAGAVTGRTADAKSVAVAL